MDSPISKSASTAKSASSAQPLPTSFGSRCYAKWKQFCCINDDDDTFDVMFRKMGAALMVLGAPVPLGFGIYYTYLTWFASTRFDSDMTSTRIHSIFLYPFAFCVALPCIWLKIKKGSIDTWQIDVTSFTVLGFIAMNVLTLPQYNNTLTALATSMYAILARAKYASLHCVLSLFLCLVQTINASYLEEADHMWLPLLPGWRHGPPSETLVGGITALACITVLIVAIAVQSAEHTRQISAAEAAIEVSKHTVDLLRRYDTRGVNEVLEEADNSSRVDPKLVALLRAMNCNLESYKPFLPNYLFQKADDDFCEDSSEFDEGSFSLTDTPRGPTSGSAGLESVDSSQTSSATSHSLTAQSENGGKTRRRSLQKESVLQGLSCTNGEHFEGKICVALIGAPQLHNFHGCKRDSTAEGALFVDEILKLAQESRASVHSMIGDCAQLTWNATHRLSQPETKAASFFGKLTELAVEKNNFSGVESSPSGSWRPAGALFTGKATCLSHTSSTTRQHASLLSASWMGALNVAFSLAQEHDALLIDDVTDVVSEHHFESVVVDQVWFNTLLSSHPVAVPSNRRAAVLLGDMMISSNPSSSLLPLPHVANIDVDGGATMNRSRRLLLEMIGPRDNGTHQDFRGEGEWMYALEQQKTQAAETVRISECAKALFSAVGPPVKMCSVASAVDPHPFDADGDSDGSSGKTEEPPTDHALALLLAINQSQQEPEETANFQDTLLPHKTGAVVVAKPLVMRLHQIASSMMR